MEDSIVAALLPDTVAYSLLYVYRLSGIGPIIEYNLHVNDSIVCRVFNKSKYIVRIDNPGNKKIWARTEARDELELQMEKGKVYFLKCSVSMGAFVGRPQLKLVNTKQGLMEFESLK